MFLTSVTKAKKLQMNITIERWRHKGVGTEISAKLW